MVTMVVARPAAAPAVRLLFVPVTAAVVAVAGLQVRSASLPRYHVVAVVAMGQPAILTLVPKMASPQWQLRLTSTSDLTWPTCNAVSNAPGSLLVVKSHAASKLFSKYTVRANCPICVLKVHLV